LFIFFFHQLRLIVVEFCFLFRFDPGHCNHFLIAQLSMISVISNKVVSLLFHSFSLRAESTVVAPSRQDVVGGGAPESQGIVPVVGRRLFFFSWRRPRSPQSSRSIRVTGDRPSCRRLPGVIRRRSPRRSLRITGKLACQCLAG